MPDDRHAYFASHIVAAFYVPEGSSVNAELFEPIRDSRTLRGEMKAFTGRARGFLSGENPGSVAHYAVKTPISNLLSSMEFRCPVAEASSDALDACCETDGKKRYLHFMIADIRVSCFPRGIVFVGIEIRLLLRHNANAFLSTAAVSLTSALTSNVRRIFTPGDNSGLLIARAENQPALDLRGIEALDASTSSLLRAVKGDTVFWLDIFSECIAGERTYLMGDRLTALSLLVSDWSGESPAFADDDRLVVARLAHGYNTQYFPITAAPGVEDLFQNVVCAVASEGAAFWVRATVEQHFLRESFPKRFSIGQYMLLLLALFQRIALSELGSRLATGSYAIEGVEAFPVDGAQADHGALANPANALWKLQDEAAWFCTQYIIARPATLTNLITYYNMLETAFGIDDLAANVRDASAAIASSAEGLYARHRAAVLEAEDRLQRQSSHETLIKLEHIMADTRQILESGERAERWVWIIAVFAELFALPYYAYYACKYIAAPILLPWLEANHVHLPHHASAWASVILTTAAIAITVVIRAASAYRRRESRTE